MRPGFFALLFLASCAPRLSIGEPCESAESCASPYVCRLGRCRVECLVQRDCPPGVTCVTDATGAGSCIPPEEAACTTSATCPSGLSCLDGECSNVCETVLDCLMGSRCQPTTMGRARCVRDESDAGVLDVPPSAEVGPDAASCTGARCVVELALAERASCVLLADRTVHCWGVASMSASPETSEVCDADRPCVTRPTPALYEEMGTVAPLGDVQSLAGSFSTFCAGRSANAACWGRDGPLGGPGAGELARPVRGAAGEPPGGTVTVGATMAIVQSEVRGMFGWGVGMFGELGTGVPESLPLAAPITAPAGLGAVRLGGWHGCGASAGRAWCWGENDLGQTGFLTPPLPLIVAADAMRPVEGVSDVVAVEPGRSSSCALTRDGEVWCWGHVSLLPNPSVTAGCEVVSTPTGPSHACGPRLVRWGPRIARLASFSFSDAMCAIDEDGALLCWGLGALIPRDMLGANDPRRIPLLPPVSRAVMGSHHACALSTDGEVWCWGENELGQLGRGGFATGILEPSAVLWP